MPRKKRARRIQIHKNSSVRVPRVAFATVGCRLNQAETEAAVADFTSREWQVVDFKEEADLYFINTCTVTGRADRSSRQFIHRARRLNSRAIVIAAGCFARRASEELASEGEVDIILGPSEKMRPFDYIPQSFLDQRPESPIIHVSGKEEKALQAAVGTRISGRTRAFLKIQDGCDHSCTYCAVTIARGPSRSVSYQDIEEGLNRVKAAKFEEVVFTGVDITAWGLDLEGEKRNFTHLVELAAKAGIPRVRLSSFEPWELTPERIHFLAEIPQWCEHLHLSLQSADPGVLNRMNRSMDLGQLKESIAELIRLRPYSTLGADMIIGFPGESEEAFNNSMAFLDEGPLHYLHVFPFSSRKGTVAASFTDKIPADIISQRARIIREAGKLRRHRQLENSIGQEAEVLIEENGKIGWTRNYLRVVLASESSTPRKRALVRLLRLADNDDMLIGEKIG